MSMLDSSPIFPSLVNVTAVTASATVEEGINVAKRKRGRPKKNDGSGEVIEQSATPRNNIGDMSMSIVGGDFTPHIFTVDKGEDIIKRIMSFTKKGSRVVSVLSANGSVANFKIRPHSSNPRYVLKFKDACEIISLSSTMVATEGGGVKCKRGGWKIVISGVFGGVFGGSLVGRLIAASPVQVVIGTLSKNPPEKKQKPKIPNALASSSTAPVQEPEMIGSSHSLSPDLDQ